MGYLNRAADAYYERLKQHREKSSSCDAPIALVAPTWKEIERLTDRIRSHLDRDGALQGKEVRRTVVEVEQLTAAQKRNPRTYQPGAMVCAGPTPIPGMQKSDWEEVRQVANGKLILAGGRSLNLAEYGSALMVGRRKEIPLKVGDRILLKGNDHRHGLFNGVRGYL